MPIANLSANAQAGLAHRAATIKNPDGSVRFANATAYGDFVMESNGLEGYAELLKLKDVKRVIVLADSKNAALAAQVDALASSVDPKAVEDIKG